MNIHEGNGSSWFHNIQWHTLSVNPNSSYFIFVDIHIHTRVVPESRRLLL